MAGEFKSCNGSCMQGRRECDCLSSISDTDIGVIAIRYGLTMAAVIFILYLLPWLLD